MNARIFTGKGTARITSQAAGIDLHIVGNWPKPLTLKLLLAFALCAYDFFFIWPNRSSEKFLKPFPNGEKLFVRIGDVPRDRL